MQNSSFTTWPIQWFEGMILMPHHFQQNDSLNTQLISHHINYISPYHFGVQHILIDGSRLGTGLFRVLEVQAIMPDHTVIFFNQSSQSVLEIDLNKHSENLRQKPLKVFLLLPEIISGQDLGGVISTRYESTEARSVVDINTGENALSIARLKPRLSLALADIPPPNFVALPLAEVAFQLQTGSFSLTHYVPPTTRVSLDSPLGILCSKLCQRIRDKLSYIQNTLKNSSQESNTYVAFSTTEMERMRQCLINGILPFEALLYTGLAHPYELFKALMALVAQGVSFNVNMAIPSFQTYNHEKMLDIFSQMATIVENSLNTIEELYISLPFTRDNRQYILMLDNQWRADEIIIGAKTPADVSEDGMMEWINHSVIASESICSRVQETRTLGAKREIIREVHKLGLSAARGMILFSVKYDPQLIKFGEPLKIFNISDTDKTRPHGLFIYLQKSTINPKASTS